MKIEMLFTLKTDKDYQKVIEQSTYRHCLSLFSGVGGLEPFISDAALEAIEKKMGTRFTRQITQKIKAETGALQAENRRMQDENRHMQDEIRRLQAENRRLQAETQSLQGENKALLARTSGADSVLTIDSILKYVKSRRKYNRCDQIFSMLDKLVRRKATDEQLRQMDEMETAIINTDDTAGTFINNDIHGNTGPVMPGTVNMKQTYKP